MQEDAYVRLGFSGARSYGPATRRRALLFVDIEHGSSIAELRMVAHRVFANVSHVVVRSESDEDGEHISRVTRSLVDASCSILVQNVGAPPALLGTIHTEDHAELLRRARTVEIEAMLEWGRAVWRPVNHHFLLPSGQHSATFVKLANAIRTHRDASVIASWLLPHFSTDGISIIADSGTLSPVLSALETSLERHRRHLGSIVVLEHYPRTGIDVQRAVIRASEHGDRVVGLLSVNSSGQLRDRLYDALTSHRGLIERWALEVVVDASRSSDEATSASVPNTDVWLFMGDPSESRQSTSAHDCELCRDPRCAPIVAIDPITFEQVHVASVKAVTPDPKQPLATHRFWTLCSRTDAIGLEEAPDASVAAHRPSSESMAVHVRLGRLLDTDDLAREVNRKMVAMNSKFLRWRPDVVLVPEGEASVDGFGSFWDQIRESIGGPERYTSFPNGSWNERLKGDVVAAKRILFLTVGVVTGSSIQKGLVGVQSARHDESYHVACLCVHARPANQREWQTLKNSFSNEIEAIWLTYISDRSPLREELQVLNRLAPDLLSDLDAALLEQRRLLCAGVSGLPLFLGEKRGDHLSSHSIFGDRLSPSATFVAVGSAMESRRQITKFFPPERLAFDLRAICRSYYDPLILSSVLRWLTPIEAWWGAAADGAEMVIEEVLVRANRDHRRILVPEILLAAAQGKVPVSGGLVARAYAEHLLEDCDDQTRQAVGLALKLDPPRNVLTPRVLRASSPPTGLGRRSTPDSSRRIGAWLRAAFARIKR